MGGMTSVTLALTHPALVERMVLLSPTISGRLSDFHQSPHLTHHDDGAVWLGQFAGFFGRTHDCGPYRPADAAGFLCRAFRYHPRKIMNVSARMRGGQGKVKCAPNVLWPCRKMI